MVDLPSPSRLSYLWNIGSLLGLFLIVQIVSGLFLSFHFSRNCFLSFESVIHVMRDVNYGWLIRVIHANGARIFFILMYIHVGRGIYYGSYWFENTWIRGITIILISIATAFLGYVLPWGQMSFWAATVITNLLSAIPYVGIIMVEWIWGGFAVGNPTLIRFFSFHFLVPFLILVVVILHLFFLHEYGSNNIMGITRCCDKVIFYPYFVIKDLFGIFIFFMLFIIICILGPYIFIDVENFIISDPLITPVHIQPEWYFLFAYTILRSVPRKIGGVIALIISIILLYVLPMFLIRKFRSRMFYYFIKMFFWLYVVNWGLLTWIGICIVEYPYMNIGIYFRIIYFSIYVGFWFLYKINDLFIWFCYNYFESN